MDQGAEGGQRHPELEPDGDVDHDGDEEHHQGLEGLAGDLLAPRRPDLVDHDLVLLGAGEVDERVDDLAAALLALVVGARDRLGLDPQVVTQLLDLDLVEAQGGDGVLGLLDGGAVGRHLPLVAAGEVDAQVEPALDAEGDQADHDEGGRDAEPEAPAGDEGVVGLPVVQPAQEPAPRPGLAAGGGVVAAGALGPGAPGRVVSLAALAHRWAIPSWDTSGVAAATVHR